LGIVPHYWIIYIFFSLYLISPFISKMLNALNVKQLRVLTVLIILFLFIENYLPLLGVQPGITFSLSGWVGVFILGYISVRRNDVISSKFFVYPGIIFLISTAVVAVLKYELTTYFYNTNPPMVFGAAAILCILKSLEGRLKKHNNLIIRSISKCSYSILLIHWYGLFVITMGFFPVQPLRFGCVGGIIATLIVALLVCFVLGFFIDNTVVIAVRTVFFYLAECIKKPFDAYKISTKKEN
ncbi:MAG: acyltransferase family protein, partial [Lachnospiraceae bacterium]|nr:acyltransferase family protein [Lachnospiraceae bacterium]